MATTIQRWLTAFNDIRQRRALEYVVQPTVDGTVSQTLNAANLAITGGGSTTASTGANSYSIVDGKLVLTATGTALPALTGLNITQSKYNVFVFLTDSGGNRSVLMGIEGATIGAIQFPVVPSGYAIIGFIVVTYGAGNFVGGTTPLDTATTVYFSPTGAYNPGIASLM